MERELMGQQEVILSIPSWVSAFESSAGEDFGTCRARISFAVELSRRNIIEGTGGPFGAAVFDLEAGTLVAAGVNLVTRSNCSIAHAEMVAIMRAQQRLGTWNLASKGRFELATSCAPCAMCLGAAPWSGVCSLLCAARDEDARGIGFDEGAKPTDWAGELKKRGIAVQQDLLRESAAAVLRAYAAGGGTIY